MFIHYRAFNLRLAFFKHIFGFKMSANKVSDIPLGVIDEIPEDSLHSHTSKLRLKDAIIHYGRLSLTKNNLIS